MKPEASTDLIQLLGISAVVFGCFGAARNDQRIIGKRSKRMLIDQGVLTHTHFEIWLI